MQITDRFSLADLTRSSIAVRRGIPNQPGPAQIENLRHTARALEQIEKVLGVHLTITSGYRSPAVNRAVGGSPTSQHVTGEAVDFVPDGVPIRAVFDWLRTQSIPFDQLIFEGGWIHISFARRRVPRRMVLVAKFDRGGARYFRPNWKPVPYEPGIKTVEQPGLETPVAAAPGERAGSPELEKTAEAEQRSLKQALAAIIGKVSVGIGAIAQGIDPWMIAAIVLLLAIVVVYVHLQRKPLTA